MLYLPSLMRDQVCLLSSLLSDDCSIQYSACIGTVSKDEDSKENFLSVCISVNIYFAYTNVHCRDLGGGNISSAMESAWISIMWRKMGQKP
jgi:hypothetical protein